MPGNKKMPDFDSLSDRVIAKTADTPTIVIKTNLDPKDPSEDNPYYHNALTNKEEKKLDQFFGQS